MDYQFLWCLLNVEHKSVNGKDKRYGLTEIFSFNTPFFLPSVSPYFNHHMQIDMYNTFLFSIQTDDKLNEVTT